MSEMEQELAKATAARAAGQDPAAAAAAAEEETAALPEGSAPVADEVASESEEQVQEEIILAGKKFKTQQEAYLYAQEQIAQAETERLLAQAREEALMQGMQIAQQPVAEAAPVVEDDFEQKFYEDPKKYLGELKESIKQEMTTQYQRDQQDAQLWNEFFTNNPDLADSREVVELVLNKNMQTVKALAQKSKDDAYKYLALKSREVFQGYAQKTRPQQELSNPEVISSPGNSAQTSVTPQKTDGEPLSMADQMRNMRRSKR